MKDKITLQSLAFACILSLCVVALNGFGVIDWSYWACFVPLYFWAFCYGFIWVFFFSIFLVVEFIKVVIDEFRNNNDKSK